MALRFHHCSVLAFITFWFSLNQYPASAQSTVIASFYIPPYQPSLCYGYTDHGVMITCNNFYAASLCYGYTDHGVMITAVSDDLWDDGAACGQMYQVTCVSGTKLGTPCYGTTTTVMVVDYCPNGCSGRTFDLSQESFAAIADTNSGLINVSYQ